MARYQSTAHHVGGAHLSGLPIDLEEPALEPAAREAPDLVDERAERELLDVVEELATRTRRLEGTENGRLPELHRCPIFGEERSLERRHQGLGGPEDGVSLAFDADVHLDA
ncbi:MAG: hypothetical protein ACE5EV_02890, partial [Gaiellales bacterium]